MFPLLARHFNLFSCRECTLLCPLEGDQSALYRTGGNKFHAPLLELRFEDFSFSTFFSDMEITTRCTDPKIAWNHGRALSRSTKVGCGIKGPIFSDLYFSVPTQPKQPCVINYPKALQISGKLDYLDLCFTPTNYPLPMKMFCCILNMFGRSRKQDCLFKMHCCFPFIIGCAIKCLFR